MPLSDQQNTASPMPPLLSLGISPCPNDTFIFDALVHKRIPLPCDFDLFMADVEDLNTKARSGHLDITKLSLAALVQVLDAYWILDAGAALGRGCGPLVVSNKTLTPEELSTASIAIPGQMTTANALLTLTDSFAGPRKEMIFDAVIPAVANGETDIGVIIHEGRFTYAAHGLQLVLDLGAWWEKKTGLPLPLGVIAVRRDLGRQTALAVEDTIRRSLLHARSHPEDSKAFTCAHAQEMDPAVMAEHIGMFVNDYSIDLGLEGRRAIRIFLDAAAKAANITLPALPLFAGE